VLAYGTPKMTATFSIGKVVRNIPLIEQSDGHYSGKFFPLPEETFNNQEVSVTLTDKAGRSTSRPISGRLLTLK